jgi:polysaccharide biosynthesis protein PslH
VVSTSIGAEGLGALDGEHLSIADDPVCFAAAVQDLLDDPARGRMLALAGRQLYLERYTWPAAWKKLVNCF